MPDLEETTGQLRKPADSSTDSTITLNRVQSDGDLSRIDKAKTFEGAENVQCITGDILSRVVTALGSIRPMDEDGQSCLELGMDGGIHGFSDSKILASERRLSGSSFAQSYGKNDSNNHYVTLSVPDSPNVLTEAVNRSFMSKINSFKTQVSVEDGKRLSMSTQDINPQICLENTSGGKASRTSSPLQYLATTARGRSSVFSILEQPFNTANTELLEKITIADLIRALVVVHTKAHIAPATPLFADNTDIPRKKNEIIRPSSPLNVTNLQVKTNRSRRGSLRPLPSYTTIFASQSINNPLKKSALLDPESATSSRRSSSIWQRKSSLRPSSLATNDSSQASAKYSRQNSKQSATNDPSQASGKYSRQNSQQSTVNRVQLPVAPTRNLHWRPAQLQLELSEKGDRNSSDST